MYHDSLFWDKNLFQEKWTKLIYVVYYFKNIVYKTLCEGVILYLLVKV